MGIPNVTRPCAFVFLRAGDRIAVSQMTDEVEGTFYRPPGGGIEFGETASEAAHRELMEELGLEIEEMSLLGVLENLFDFRGQAHHEICFVFESPLASEVLEGLDGRVILETAEADTEIIRIVRRSVLDELTLYPDGARALLR